MRTSRPLIAGLGLCLATIILAPSLLVAQPADSQAENCDVVVKVSGLRNTKGKVGIGLWNTKDGFPKDSTKALHAVMVDVDQTAATATKTFKVPRGEYAVALYHDENGNGQLDVNFLGMPTEGIGSSNNVRNKFSAPTFDQCRFEARNPEKVVPVKLEYLN
jgi:uncharacterized protein (DUF2141 family)